MSEPPASLVPPREPDALEALRASEQAYRMLVETSHDLIWSVDAQGRWTFVNAAARTIYGYDPVEMLGRPFMDFETPEQAQRDLEVFARIKAGAPHFNYETVHRRKDGTAVHLSFNAVVLRDEHGTVLGTTGTAQDISERKQVEEALQHEQSLVNSLISTIPDHIYFKDRQSRFVRINDVMVQRFGLRAPGDALGKTDFDFFSEEHARLAYADEQQVMSTGEPIVSLEEKETWPDGRITWVSTTKVALRDLEGRIIGLVGISRDITGRKASEVALRDSEEKFHAVFAQSPLAIVLTTLPEGQVVDANAAAEVLLGRKLADVRGRTTMELNIWVEVADRERYLRLLQQAGTVNGLEARMRRTDGVEMVVLCHGRVVRIGGQSFVLNSLLDVTERRRAEDALRLEDAALEAAANAVFITGCDGVIQWINPAFTTLSGFGAGEAVGRKPSLVKSGAHPEAFYRQIWETVRAGRVWRGQVTNRHRDGHLYVAEQTIAPVKNARGEVTHFVSVQQDITDRQRAEDELRWRTAFFEAQVDSALDGILVVDRAGKKILQNRRVGEVWKIPRAIVEDKDDAAQVRFCTNQTKDPRQFAAKVAHLNSHPDAVSHDEIELVDGSLLDRYSSPVRGKAGELYGRIWTFRDITERRRLEEQFRQSQKMESVGQLAGGVAHDFNNILTVIQGHLALLDLPGNPAEVVRDSISEIKQAADRAANLTRQLLTFSRRQAMRLCPLDLNAVVTNMARLLQRILGEDINLELHLSPHDIVVSADAGMMEQVLLNLAVNSRDAMPRGGRLLIETSPVEFDGPGAAREPSARAGKFWCLTITDTGTGIPAHILPRIFEPFFTTKDLGKGTGLGLATVYGIVQQHEGWIAVASEPGRGTTFRVYLPRPSSATLTPPPPPAEIAVRGGRETILLVEDEPAVRALVTNLLGRLGYRVIAAATGPLALELWREHREEIRLMLTDLVMPGGMSGFELGAQLIREAPGLRVIYTSGYSPEIAGRHGELVSGVNFLAKPFEMDQLLQTIRDALDDAKS